MDQKKVINWMIALAVMAVIFLFSSQPSDNLPNFDWADKLVKKSGHVLVYGLLAGSYWNALGWEKKKRPLAWLLAILYAVTDEYHQSFVPGRHASVLDILIFDNLGALISLWGASLYLKQKRPDKTSDRHSH